MRPNSWTQTLQSRASNKADVTPWTLQSFLLVSLSTPSLKNYVSAQMGGCFEVHLLSPLCSAYEVSGQWQYLRWVALCTSIHSLCWKFPVPVDPVPICILSVAVVWEKCRKWQKAGDIILTRAGREGMGDELGAWPGRFRALNLGTTATLTLRRGMFYGKRSDSGLLSWE